MQDPDPHVHTATCRCIKPHHGATPLDTELIIGLMFSLADDAEQGLDATPIEQCQELADATRRAARAWRALLKSQPPKDPPPNKTVTYRSRGG